MRHYNCLTKCDKWQRAQSGKSMCAYVEGLFGYTFIRLRYEEATGKVVKFWRNYTYVHKNFSESWYVRTEYFLLFTFLILSVIEM